MNYGIVDGKMKLVAIFKDERHRNACYKYVFDALMMKEYARVKVEEGVNLNTS